MSNFFLFIFFKRNLLSQTFWGTISLSLFIFANVIFVYGIESGKIQEIKIIAKDGEFKTIVPDEKKSFVVHPQDIEIRIRLVDDSSLSFINMVYEDEKEPGDKVIRLSSLGNKWYGTSIKTESWSATDKSFRKYTIKRYEFYEYTSYSGWLNSNNLTQEMWNICVKKEWRDNQWWVYCHNGQREVLLRGSSFEGFKNTFATVGGVNVWLNKIETFAGNYPLNIEMSATELAAEFKEKMETGSESPCLQSLKIRNEWDEEFNLLESSPMKSPIRVGKNGLKIFWNAQDNLTNVNAKQYQLILYRPDPAHGDKRRVEWRADYGGTTNGPFMDSSGKSIFSWGEHEVKIDGESFTESNLTQKAPSGFPSGQYTLNLRYVDADSNSNAEEIFYFEIDSVAPELLINSVNEQNGIVEINFKSGEANARYDLAVSASQKGPFNLLTRDVMFISPPKVPWFYTDISLGERWETVQENQGTITPYRVDLFTLLSSLPSYARSTGKIEFYLQARSVDLANNRWFGPLEKVILDLDFNAPEEKIIASGEEIKIYDFGNSGGLKGAFVDQSRRNNNFVIVTLIQNGNAVTSSTYSVPTDEMVYWELKIPEQESARFPQGRHSVEIQLKDADGNRAIIPVFLDVDVAPFQLEINENIFTQSSKMRQAGKDLWSIDFQAKVKENSFLSIFIDGKSLANKLFIGENRSIQTRLYSEYPISEGKHSGRAVLSRPGKKDIETEFNLIVDNKPPQIRSVIRTDTQIPLFSIHESVLPNIISKGTLSFFIDSVDDSSKVNLKYFVSDSEEDILRNLSNGNGKEMNDAKIEIPVSANLSYYLGIYAEDEAGNSATKLYPIYYDNTLPEMTIKTIDQLAPDRKTVDRNHFWLNFSGGETEPTAARYDLSVSLRSDGDWKLLSPSIIESSPPQEPWVWNGYQGEGWETVRKAGNEIVPFQIGAEQLKGKLEIMQFPGIENPVKLYWRIRSRDYAGNEFSEIKPFFVTVDRRAPEINLDQKSFRIIDFNRDGGAITGHVEDLPEEDSPINIELRKGETIISQTVTSSRVDGEFLLTVPKEKEPFLPNGQHSLKLVAIDIDGNETSADINLEMDVKSLKVEFEDELYVKTEIGSEPGKSALRLDFGIVPNSQISLRIDGRQILSKVSVGSVQRFNRAVEIPFTIQSGRYPSVIQIYKDGQSASKLFTLVVDNRDPAIQRVVSVGDNQELFSFQETEMNWIRSRILRLEVTAKDETPLTYQFGVGHSLESARKNMFNAEKKGKMSFVELTENELNMIAIGVFDSAGNITEEYYPVTVRTAAPSISIRAIELSSEKSSEFNLQSVRINFDTNEPLSSKTRYDVSVSLDGSEWKLLSRDVVDHPPDSVPWVWDGTDKDQWENLFGIEQNGMVQWLPYDVTLSKIREVLGADMSSTSNGKAILYFKVRAMDRTGEYFFSEPYLSELEFDLRPPEIGIDCQSDGAVEIVDFGSKPGSVISGWIKDGILGANYADIELIKEKKVIQKNRIFLEGNESRAWQLSIPEQAANELPNGIHELTIKATDKDGNSTQIRVKVKVNILQNEIEIEDSVYASPLIREGKTHFRFKGTFKENSFLFVEIDGKNWLDYYPIGSDRNVDFFISSIERLSSGKHELSVRLKKDNRLFQKKVQLIVKTDLPNFEKFTDAGGSVEFVTAKDNAEINYNIANNSEIQIKAVTHDSDIQEIRYVFHTDPNEAVRQLEMGYANSYQDMAHVHLAANQLTYIGFEAVDQAGNKSQPQFLSFIYDTKEPDIKISRVEQKSQDGSYFDRNVLWFYFKSEESEFSKLRFDLSVSTDNVLWKLITRDVIDHPPLSSPWIWQFGCGEKWQNLVSQGFDRWPPFVIPADELLEKLERIPLPKKENNSVLYFRVRSIDLSGRVGMNSYKAELESDSRAPEIYVNGQSDIISVYDVGQYGGLSGTVKDRPFDLENFTQIFLVKDGISVATAAIRTSEDIFYSWSLTIPEHARSFLGEGIQSMTIVARDSDGNETCVPIKVNVNIQELAVNIEDPFYMRTDNVFDRTKKSSFHLKAEVKENSQLSLYVDDFLWFSEISIGSKRKLDERFESEQALSEGEHRARIILNRGGQTLSKEFKVIVDNSAPQNIEVIDGESGEKLKPETENVFGRSELSLLVQVTEPNLKFIRYLFTKNAAEMTSVSIKGEFVDLNKKMIHLTLPSGTSGYFVLEAEDQSGNISQQRYAILTNIDQPFTRFESKYLISCPEQESSSGYLTVGFNGLDPVPIAGQMRQMDAPGRVEIVGFKKSVQSVSDLNGNWQLVIPPDSIPTGEEILIHFQLTGKNGKKSFFPLRILRNSEITKILLDQPIDMYQKKQSLTIIGTVQSLSPIESFFAFLRPKDEKVFIISNGKTVQDKFYKTEFDTKTGRFSISFYDLEETQTVPYSLELTVKTKQGQETIYTELDSRGQTTIPYFYVDATAPAPPIMKIVSRIEKGILFEGTTAPDPFVTVVLVDSKEKELGKTSIYVQAGDLKGSWNKKIENLSEGDYEVYAYTVDLAGNRSIRVGPEKFTIFRESNLRPALYDFTKGQESYSKNSRPMIKGNAGKSQAQVQIFETGNYLGYTIADREGNFNFMPEGDLKNGWKNFVAVVTDSNGQRMESEVLRVYFAVNGAPSEDRLVIKPSPKSALEYQTVSFLVTSKEGIPMTGARVIFVDQTAETNKSGRVDMVTPSLQGPSVKSVPVRAEIQLTNGMKLSGNSLLEVAAGDHWNESFSPNGDGINDYLVFRNEDLPARIMQFRRDEIVKVVDASDGYRWDGKKNNGTDCEPGLYLIRTKSDRKMVVQLVR